LFGHTNLAHVWGTGVVVGVVVNGKQHNFESAALHCAPLQDKVQEVGFSAQPFGQENIEHNCGNGVVVNVVGTGRQQVLAAQELPLHVIVNACGLRILMPGHVNVAHVCGSGVVVLVRAGVVVGVTVKTGVVVSGLQHLSLSKASQATEFLQSKV